MLLDWTEKPAYHGGGPHLPEDVAQALLSDRAASTRDELRRAVNEWKSIETAADAALAALTEFGAQEACL